MTLKNGISPYKFLNFSPNRTTNGFFCDYIVEGLFYGELTGMSDSHTELFAEKALPLPKMSHNALFLSRLVKGVFLRENFLQEMLKSGLTIGPFLSYLLEGTFSEAKRSLL